MGHVTKKLMAAGAMALGLFAGWGVAGAQAQDAEQVVTVDIPALSLNEALKLLGRQAGIHVVFYSKESKGLTAPKLSGRYTPSSALQQLLANTGLSYQFVNESTVAIRPKAETEGSSMDYSPADQMRLAAAADGEGPVNGRAAAEADEGSGFVLVEDTKLKPVTVGGNLDLPRGENDPLPYTVFTKEEIERSGSVQLTEFLRKHVLQNDPITLGPDQAPPGDGFGATPLYVNGSSQLNLRGYGTDQTVILVNGRRLPQAPDRGLGNQPPDVNAIPLNTIERIEILPASASAVYGANAIGGVINIVLKQNYETTQLSMQYDNATGGYDAPRSSLALSHGQSLFDGKGQLRVAGTFSKTIPPTESELGYRQAERARLDPDPSPENPSSAIFSSLGATPNIVSLSGAPLFGPGTPAFTSVAPGSDGSGGLAAYAGREGMFNLDFFDAPGLFDNPNALGAQYGRRGENASVSASLAYQLLDRLQLSLDGRYNQTTNYGGKRLDSQLLFGVPADHPNNAFGQDVIVNFLEYIPEIGEDLYRSRGETYALAFGSLLEIGDKWQMVTDAQYSRSTVDLRGFAQLNFSNLQNLLQTGEYNPFRDTRVHAPSAAFYEQVAMFYGPGGIEGKGINRGKVDTHQYVLRFVGQQLRLPTGEATLVLGGDYIESKIHAVDNPLSFADGTPAPPTGFGFAQAGKESDWGIYGELRAPLVPDRWLPRFMKRVEGDIAYRYAGGNTYEQSPNPPTLGLRFDFLGGVSLRTSYTSAFRSPDPVNVSPAPFEGDEPVTIGFFPEDPLRPGDIYDATLHTRATHPDLQPEDSETITAGLILLREMGAHRVRASLDYNYTDKTNEITTLPFFGGDLLANEQHYPGLVVRADPVSGDPYGVGRIVELFEHPINVFGRTSKDWNMAVDYAWNRPGGVLGLYANAFYFQSYQTQLLSNSPVVENIDNPDASFFSFLKYRGNFGVSWTRREFGVGLDGQYHHAKIIPRFEWDAQGSDHIERYLAFDFWLQSNLGRLLPRQVRAISDLRAQLRVNNLLDSEYPFYVQAQGDRQVYGDWRGRTYSLTLTVGF